MTTEDLDGTVSWRALLAETVDRLRGGGIEAPEAEARWIVETACGLEGAEFVLGLDDLATVRGVAHLDAMVGRRLTGEPVQYVTGNWGFRRLDLLCDARVLIPRPETEQVVEVALRLVAGRATVLCADLGTGSGAIGLALASELPLAGTTVWLTDASADALDVARANTAGIGRAASNVRIAGGHWYDALPRELAGAFDIVVSNPPYIAHSDARVEPIVRDFEPHEALFSGADGLDAVRVIARDAAKWLAADGWLVLEIGSGQAAATQALLRDAGLVDVDVHRDLAGHDRVAVGRRA